MSLAAAKGRQVGAQKQVRRDRPNAITLILQDSKEEIGLVAMSDESIMLSYVGSKTTFVTSGTQAAFITFNGFEPPIRMISYATLSAPWDKDAFEAAQKDPSTLVPFFKSAYAQALAQETTKAEEVAKRPVIVTDIAPTQKDVERILLRKLSDMVEVLSDPSMMVRHETKGEHYKRILRMDES